MATMGPSTRTQERGHGYSTDLESFVTDVTCPDDFDAFWDEVKAELNGIPLDARTEPDPLRSTESVKVYQATYRSLGGLADCEP